MEQRHSAVVVWFYAKVAEDCIYYIYRHKLFFIVPKPDSASSMFVLNERHNQMKLIEGLKDLSVSLTATLA